MRYIMLSLLAVATASRDMCYGPCPAYSVEMRGDGVVRFTGEKFVDSLRPAPANVGRATVIAVLQAFETLKFSSLRGYDSKGCYEVTDHSSVRVTLTYDGKTHTVDHYTGCSRAPKALTDLETAIDRLLGVDRWIGRGEGKREPEPSDPPARHMPCMRADA
jgi:hypothetical protein